ncbi:MAG: LLM class flavin-dependent oxidoreductase, partial [Chloroflexota bacterium]
VVPQVPGGSRPLTPDDVRAMLAAIQAERGSMDGFECLVEPWAEPELVSALVPAFAQAGATWWVESAWTKPDAGEVRARIAAGPPRPA